MGYIFDQIPWWAWVFIAGGGGAAIIAFVPGALALVVGIWNAMPRWLQLTLLVCGGFVIAYFAGRNKGNKNAREAQARKDAKAVETRQEVHDEVQKLKPTDVDKRLDKYYRD